MDLPLDQVQTTSSLHNTAHLARLEAKGGILKLLLHVSLAKVAEVASLARRGAIRLGEGELAEGDAARLDLVLVGLDDLVGVLLGAGDFSLDMFVSGFA